MDDAVRTADPSTARWGRRSTLLLMWSLAELVTILVYAFAGRLWGFVVAGVLLALVFIFTCYYYLRRTRGSEESTTVGQQQQNEVNGDGVGVGLSQGDIEAIPAFEYCAAGADAGGGSGSEPSSWSSVEECAVCISVLRDGETVRRLTACGHAFHARCINGWLRGHATCPICRAGIKVVAGDGEPSPVAAAV
ncbi:putative RING-H2 finger protein ATL37 [Sorghum bicolor]|uniref:RING-type domain-containing protein n=1 Tax=Sorghum bicolor TaxID=4558 RepID=C5Z855_SORBI|nr:putative RING-H2 finger protein ATL37 [Sorghum bicolor]EER90228.1 hypothetical protein SORBI_3010G231400 [Sorghum bicolor]|eukprot:XP_002438861.1 putative RING-H2 finger protein ATL37 [Sorghum bicolor]